MQLYTREQMIEAFQYGKTLKGFDWIGDMIDSLTPIELPSDEEILNKALDTYRDFPNNPKEHPEWQYSKDINAPRKRSAFLKGAKWVIEQIKNQQL